MQRTGASNLRGSMPTSRRRWTAITLVTTFVWLWAAVAVALALPVIPGAAGYGMETPAGRGGMVYRVTNLNASGPGSLKACIDQIGPRVCVFEVSGTIELTSDLIIRNPFITIAGQTAPSPGITIKGAAIWVQTNDVLIQHIRVRVGDNPMGPNPENRDALKISHNSKVVTNVVIANSSFSWGVDETAGTWDGVHDVTFYKNIFSEPLDDSLHPKGRHGYGTLFGPFDTTRVTLYGNLNAHNVERNPLSRAAALVMVNNVIYNWRGRGLALQGEHGVVSHNTIVGNYFKRGPAGGGDAITMWGTGGSLDMTPGSTAYFYDNFAPGYDPNDPWAVVTFGSALDASFRAATPPVWNEGLQVLPHAEAYEMVLRSAGARPADRDPVDARIIEEVRTGTGRIIDSQDDVGGWPQLAVNHRPLELPANPNADDDMDGYTNLEEWLHQLDCEVGGNCPPEPGASAASTAMPPAVALPPDEERPPIPNFISVRTDEEPVLDGEREALWDRAVVHEIPSPGPSLGGSVRSLWNDDALFVFVEVTGPGVNLSDGLLDTPWRADSIELPIGGGSVDFKVFTFVIGDRQHVKVDRGGGGVPPEQMVQGFMKQVDGGWVAELKIVAGSGGALNNFRPAETANQYTIGVRANVMVNGQRVYFDVPAGLHPNEPPTFSPLVFE